VVGESPEHVVLSADGKTLFVNNVDDGTVSVVALERGEVAKTIPVGSVLHGIDLSEDGKTLFVTAMADDKLVAIDVASGAVRAVGLSPSPYHVAALRGSSKLYISSADEPKMWVLDQDTLAVVGEIEIGGKGHQMAEVEIP
jgi:DNA-binding beta-propeller fold protein YncE